MTLSTAFTLVVARAAGRTSLRAPRSGRCSELSSRERLMRGGPSWGRPIHSSSSTLGAGPGTLARAVYRAEPACLSALRYTAVEVSARQREHHPHAITSVPTMPPDVGEGVILANELLDNLPFDVQQFDEGVGWREVLVDVDGDRLVEVLVDTTFDLALAAGSGGRSLRVPVQRAARAWLTEALAAVERGRVVVLDYCVPGYPVSSDRDWLRTFAEHDRGGPPLDHPGYQDITADIDIGGLRAVRPPTLERSQADWLRSHGIEDLVAQGRAAWAEAASSPDLAAIAMRSRVPEAQALLDPAGLGAFCVLEWEVGLEKDSAQLIGTKP